MSYNSPMDRDSVARRDFSTARHGYDRGEVDEHLSALAEHVDALERKSSAGAAEAAAEQVRAIVATAEQSAARIEADAQASAAARADDLQQAIDGARERVGAVEAELDRMAESLRGIAVTTASTAASQAPPAAEAPSSPGPDVDLREQGDEPTTEKPEPKSRAPRRRRGGRGASGSVAGSEGARLIALNMALSGAPREETERYLAENFELEDRDAVLEDVYARVGG